MPRKTKHKTISDQIKAKSLKNKKYYERNKKKLLDKAKKRYHDKKQEKLKKIKKVKDNKKLLKKIIYGNIVIVQKDDE